MFLFPISFEEDKNIVNHIQPYMFNNQTILSFIHYPSPKIVQNNQSQPSKERQILPRIPKDIFVPLDKDSLFWCLYIIIHGIDKYKLLNNRNFVTEKKIKIEYVERSRKEKQLLKQYKFSSILDFENMLANEHIIHINTFFSLCVLENINVFLVYENKYMELFMNDSDIIFAIFIVQPKKFGFKQTNKEWCDHFKTINTLTLEKPSSK
jgi:hypothetical protein